MWNHKKVDMFVHGHLMFPDYVAIAILMGNLVFLTLLVSYAINAGSNDLKTQKIQKPNQRLKLPFSIAFHRPERDYLNFFPVSSYFSFNSVN